MRSRRVFSMSIQTHIHVYTFKCMKLCLTSEMQWRTESLLSPGLGLSTFIQAFLILTHLCEISSTITLFYRGEKVEVQSFHYWAKIMHAMWVFPRDFLAWADRVAASLSRSSDTPALFHHQLMCLAPASRLVHSGYHLHIC